MRRPLLLDTNLGQAYVSRATIRIFSTYDWTGAEEDFKKAKQLSPRYAGLYHFYAHYFEIRGQMKEAIETFQTGVELDPLSPVLKTELAACYYHARQYETAEDLCRKTLGEHPAFLWVRHIMAFVLVQEKTFKEALDLLAEARGLNGGDGPMTLAQEGYALGLSGRKDLAREKLAEFKAASVKSGQLSPYYQAMIHMALDEDEAALKSLEDELEIRSLWMSFIAVDPIFERLHSQERFQRILRRMGLRP